MLHNGSVWLGEMTKGLMVVCEGDLKSLWWQYFGCYDGGYLDVIRRDDDEHDDDATSACAVVAAADTAAGTADGGEDGPV